MLRNTEKIGYCCKHELLMQCVHNLRISRYEGLPNVKHEQPVSHTNFVMAI
jgi:hypothetical protein